MTAPSHRLQFPYYLVFAALLGLLALTVEAARYDLGRWNFPIAVSIATTKMLLIIACFMHLWPSTTITRLAACAGFCWLTIMFALTIADYWTRSG